MQELLFQKENIQEVHKKLFLIPRAGWVKRGVQNPETVGDHTESLISLAQKWHKELEIKNLTELQNMLAFHDWPEIIVGDILTYQFDGQEYSDARKNKQVQEECALKNICEMLGNDGKKILEYWREFEQHETRVATVAYQLDKIQAVIKALEYEQMGEPVSAMEFVNEVVKRNQIHHLFLLDVLEKIKHEAKDNSKIKTG